MVLFFISVCLIFLSSYLLTSILVLKKNALGFLYFLILGFAQVVLTLEVLSLFRAITEFWVLFLNSATTLCVYYFWQKRGKPLWGADFEGFMRKFINALRLDKSLIFLLIGFLFFIFVTIFLCVFMSANSADGYAYHVVRSLFWVESGSLNHFGIADIRALCMPINSELLYTWVFLFLKKDLGFGFFGFCGYLLTMVSLYNILGLMGYCLRKKLWVVFILSSFAGVIGQASGLETDIIIAGLVLACINLFWYGLKNNDEKKSIFFASLAYAIAIGVKTTAIMMIPAIGLLLVFLCIKYRGKKFYNPFLMFLGFGLLNFILFSSYNYVLNFVNYGNIVGSKSIIEAHRNIYGVRAIFANFIKYIFLFFDFSSFRWSEYAGDWILNFRNGILNVFGLSAIKDGVYTARELVLNNRLIDVYMLGGILGFLIYLPAWVWSLFSFDVKSKKKTFMFLFGLVFLINILVMSYSLAFMVYSVRFLLGFLLVSSPFLAVTYFRCKNPLKYIVIFFALSNMFLITTHLAIRPFFKIVQILSHTSVTNFRYATHCKWFTTMEQSTNEMCVISGKLEQKYPQYKKIIVFANTAEYAYLLKRMMFKGYRVDFGSLENISDIDLKTYDLAIMPDKKQEVTTINDFENRIRFYAVQNDSIIFDPTYLSPCIYINNQGSLLLQGDGQYPFLAQCLITPRFLEANKFRLLEVIGSYRKNDKKSKVYKIYKID